MLAPTAVHGQEVIELVSIHPDGIRLSLLIETIFQRFGESATFHTSAGSCMDIDALLSFFEDRDKLRIRRGVVFPCTRPALRR